MNRVDEVLEFWFGTSADQNVVAKSHEALWWSSSPEMDREIDTRFAGQRRDAISGALAGWLDTPRGRLASIILIDQFSRNLFRGTPEAFAHDALSLKWCQEGIASGADRSLRPIERTFFYLPLEHSEQRADQAESVRQYEGLAIEVPAELKELFDYYAGFAHAHRKVIDRFDRFPHRNVILGRESTAEEIEFLNQPGSSF